MRMCQASQLAQWERIYLPKQETQVPSLGGVDALEQGMATHSGILPWNIPRTEEPGSLQSTASQRVGYN